MQFQSCYETGLGACEAWIETFEIHDFSVKKFHDLFPWNDDGSLNKMARIFSCPQNLMEFYFTEEFRILTLSDYEKIFFLLNVDSLKIPPRLKTQNFLKTRLKLLSVLTRKPMY
jgi:hypothetical protein